MGDKTEMEGATTEMVGARIDLEMYKTTGSIIMGANKSSNKRAMVDLLVVVQGMNFRCA